jgi:hypothetical protein
MPLRGGQRFEDLAWRVAASSLYEQVPRLRTSSPSEYGMSLPFLCFVAELLSKDWKHEEARDVFISRTGEVSINSFAGLETDVKALGSFRAQAHK